MFPHIERGDVERLIFELEARIAHDLETRHHWLRERIRFALDESGRALSGVRDLHNQLENLLMPLADQIGQLQGVANDLASTLAAYEAAVQSYVAAHEDDRDTTNAKAQLAAAGSGIAAVTQSLTDSLAGLQTAVAEVQPPAQAAPVLPTQPTADGGGAGETQVQPPAAPGGAPAPGTPTGAGNDNIGNQAGEVPAGNAADQGQAAAPGGAQPNPFTTPDNPAPSGDPDVPPPSSAPSSSGTTSTSTDTSASGAGSSAGSSSPSSDSSSSSSSSSTPSTSGSSSDTTSSGTSSSGSSSS